MIPQRRLSRDGYGNGVSCRVEACRRRLRTIRAGGSQVQVDERLVEFVAEDSEFCGAPTAKLDLDGVTAERRDGAGIT